MKKLEAKVHELKELQRMAEELNTEMDALKNDIRTTIGNREEVTVGAYRITNKAITSSRLDTNALRKELPELAERFTKTTIVHRLVIV